MSRASFPIGSLCDYDSGTLGHVTCVQVAEHTPEGVRVLFPWIAHPGKVITDLSRLTVRDLPHVCNNERSRSPIRAGTATATEQPKLHVSGFPGSMPEQDVREYLGSAGTTRSMQVPYHSRNTLRGYAFVIYATQEGTDRALSWDGTWWGNVQWQVFGYSRKGFGSQGLACSAWLGAGWLGKAVANHCLTHER